MKYETILYETRDQVATITLNRPERLNAISRQLIEEFGQAIATAEADAGVRCVLLTGAGRGFCAGADLADPSRGDTATRDAGAALDKYYNPTIRRMRAMAKPIVAAVNGVAAGAGMSLALASDIAIAGKSASFLQAFARIGLLPDAGSTWLLPRLVGEQRARALAMSSSGPATVAVVNEPTPCRFSTSRCATNSSTAPDRPLTVTALLRRSSAEASTTTRPRSITMTCSSRLATSSIRCVDSRTVRGCSA